MLAEDARSERGRGERYLGARVPFFDLRFNGHLSSNRPDRSARCLYKPETRFSRDLGEIFVFKRRLLDGRELFGIEGKICAGLFIELSVPGDRK